MRRTIIVSMLLLFIVSCNPKITKTIDKNFPSLDNKEEIIVFDETSLVPVEAEYIGTLKIDDSGFSTRCDWETVMAIAKKETRKAGGNILKINEHLFPEPFGSKCHRIDAAIYRMKVTDELPSLYSSYTVHPEWNFALLVLYSPNGIGPVVNYDIYLDKEIIAHANNNWKTYVRVEQPGNQILWAKTISESRLPLTLEKGKIYYIRCNLKVGIGKEYPTLELVDSEIGKSESGSVMKK